MDTIIARSTSKDHNQEIYPFISAGLTKNKTFDNIITTVPDNPNGMQKFINHKTLMFRKLS